MVSHEIEAIVQRLLSDDGFLQTFQRSPEAALSGRVLSAEERRAILRLRPRLRTADGPAYLAIGPEVRWP